MPPAMSVSASRTLSFSSDDMAGGIYYWQSVVNGTTAGKAGGIFRHDFGNPSPLPEIFLSPTTGSNRCFGCHFLSRDGLRMTAGSDDADSDDEYGDLSTTVYTVTTGGALGPALPGTLPPGFQAFSPDHK